MSKVRGFCFTTFDFSQENLEKLAFLQSDVSVQYLIVGFENCPMTNKPHWQGYVYFKNKRAVASSHKIIPGNVTPADGSPYQNYEYCSKSGNFHETGLRPVKTGRRTDLERIKELVKAGATREELWEASTSMQAFKFGLHGMEFFTQERQKPTVIWYWGPTGSGKTRTATEKYPQAWISGKNLRWWLGYNGESEVIIDDFRKDFCTFHELLRILDRYRYNVEVKGGHAQLRAEIIIITCPHPPELVYEGREDVNQLLRRIDCVVRFGPDQRLGEIIEPQPQLENFIPPKDKEEI